MFPVRQRAGEAHPLAQEGWEQGVVARELFLGSQKRKPCEAEMPVGWTGTLQLLELCWVERDAAALGPDVRPAVLAQELAWVPLSLTPVPPFSN